MYLMCGVIKFVKFVAASLLNINKMVILLNAGLACNCMLLLLDVWHHPILGVCVFVFWCTLSGIYEIPQFYHLLEACRLDCRLFLISNFSETSLKSLFFNSVPLSSRIFSLGPKSAYDVLEVCFHYFLCVFCFEWNTKCESCQHTYYC